MTTPATGHRPTHPLADPARQIDRPAPSCGPLDTPEA